MPDQLTFAVMGAGGIGGYFGGRLAAAGEDVTFIARGAHLKALRAHGLRVLSPLGDFSVDPVQATDDPARVGPVDYVLFMVKLQDVATAASLIQPLVGEATTIVPFQNGIDAPDQIRATYGPERMLGGVAYIPATIESPGVIRHGGTLAKLAIGEFGRPGSVRAERLAAAFTAAGVEIRVVEKIEETRWSKFIFLGAMSALTALTRLPIGPIRENPDTRALLAAAMTEIVAVGRARGIALATDEVERQMAFADGLGPDMKSSLLNDLEAGRPLEVEYLSGAVARLGAELGVDTPIHRMAYAILKPYVSGPPQHPG